MNVEGAEKKILENIPWHKVNIKVIILLIIFSLSAYNSNNNRINTLDDDGEMESHPGRRSSFYTSDGEVQFQKISYDFIIL